jgi:lipopolysaccharide export system permease protein
LGTILQRMIFWDLLKIFAITLVSLTGLFLLGGLVSEASQRGLAPAQIFTIIPLMIPSMLPYTIPAATLFATCNVYGRLAKDNEIIALRAAGVNLGRILIPSFVLGVAASGATLALYYHVIPRSCALVREHLLSDVNELLMTALKRNGSISHRELPYVLFVREVRGDRLFDAIFKKQTKPPKERKKESGDYDIVARARWATLHVEKRYEKKDGKQVEVNELVVSMSGVICNDDKPGESMQFYTHDKQEYREPLPAKVLGDRDVPRACDLSWPELLRKTAELAERERQTAAELRKAAACEHLEKGRQDWFVQTSAGQKYSMREYRSFEAEIQLRPSLALGCLCFVLIGGPIGIWANRADFLSSFVIGFLPMIATYYPLVMCATKLAKDGRVPMIPAIWTADVVFLCAACFLCWRLIRK